MNHYTLYNPDSGEVTGAGSTNAPMQDIPTQGAGLLWDVLLDKALHFVADGLALAYTDAQRAAKAARPGAWAQWSNASMQWLDPRSLQDLKAQKNSQINAARLAANQASFSHAGKAVACDPLSRSDIDATKGYVSLNGVLPADWPGGWKALDNSYLPIADVDAWKAFYASMFAQGNANFAHAQTLKGQLDSASTTEQIQAITWN